VLDGGALFQVFHDLGRVCKLDVTFNWL
jgi:hypothetical protein